MSMVVRTNINSMNANRNLSINNSQVATSLEKLASGYAINRAADDASGLAVSEKMRAQITGLDQGTENALDGVCLIQTAEGAMDEIHNMLNRITELATKSANGTIQDEVDRQAIQAEVDVLIDEIDRIALSTNYNGIPLLDGSLAGGGVYSSGGSGSVDGIYIVPLVNYDTSLGYPAISVDLTGLMGSDLIGNELIITHQSDKYMMEFPEKTTIIKFVSIDNSNNSVTDMGNIDTSNSVNEIIMYIDPNLTAKEAVSAFSTIDNDFANGNANVIVAQTINNSGNIGGDVENNGFALIGFWGGNGPSTNTGLNFTASLTLTNYTGGDSSSSTSYEDGLILHVADQNASYNKIQVYIDAMTGEALQIKPLYVDTQESAGAAIDKIRNAINYVSTNRGNLGALQNRLERTVNNNNNTSENMSSAKSSIKDCDMAKEMMEYTKMNVLTQSAQSMLAQSNQAPQAILSLLG